MSDYKHRQYRGLDVLLTWMAMFVFSWLLVVVLVLGIGALIGRAFGS